MILSLNIEKPSWWSSNSNSGGNGLGSNGAMTALANVAQQVEISEKYCGDSRELEMPLLVHNMDLDAEEHLLLANTDELTPVEWYAVNYVHGVTDKKQQQKGDCFRVERDDDSVEDEIGGLGNENGALFQSEQCSFEELAKLEADRQWQDGDAASQLFYYLDDQRNVCFDESALEKPFMQMRMEGMETHFDVYKPPQPPSDDMATMDLLLPEPGTTTDNQMTFRVSYRVPAPPPLPLPGKSKLDHAAGLLGDKAGKFSKKQRANSAGMSKSGISGVGLGSGTGMTAAGVKRKLESQLGGVKSGSLKEQRVDLEGIPVPDVSAFADDDFWGDTNLDALDSAEWDDQALLSGILGVGGAGTASSTASSSGTASSGVAGSMLSATGGAISAGTESGHVKAGSQKSKKSKTAGGSGRPRKSSMSGDSGRDAWSVHDDIVLKKLFELYGANWTLIAQVFNSATAVSRFFCKKRSPRQCYDRYGKIISGSLATSTTASNSTAGANASKDGKSGSSLKAQRAAAAAIAAASQLTPAVLDVRIGLPRSEMLLAFPYRHSLPGLPPPSIVGTPSLVEMTLKHRKKQVAGEPTTGKKSTSASGGGLDDLKSIRSSFDAIIQCMKHKTSPPPIPIPVGPGAGTTTNATSTSGTSSSSTDLGTKASLTAAPFPASAPPVASAPTKTDSNSQTDAGSKAATGKGVPVVVPPPHKSHTDMISLLPAAVLGPDEVIKRSKEAAVVAVQAAAAVASVSRDGSPLSASGDVMLGAGSGFGASVAGSMPRRSHAASITSEMMAPLPPTVPAAAATSGAPPQATTAAWGDMQRTMVANGLNSVDAGAPGTNEADTHAQRNPPMPVTTSTLLHVLDRMPEIKNKIQAILNRTDCSESQKVAMIARLLSNTNAINNNASSDPPDATAATSSAVLSALTADAAMLSSSGMLVDSETAIPMPASLNASAPPTSSASAPSGQYQPPASQS
ncbi:hypothetical protein PHYBOEH_009412 [Phytophthora boehmeriae]|uniref:Myb-like domain-containing protein n=1 Tax=Phytophthora boehmeriae TaxID=109152 RepID=A0A8T1VX77_9STRA|nr:hypothetical protein PHYBOEH_009412 [Phytophthora boehmeriae]